MSLEKPFVLSCNPSAYDIERQRDQILFFMDVDLMMFEADKVTTFDPELWKQSHPGHL